MTRLVVVYCLRSFSGVELVVIQVASGQLENHKHAASNTHTSSYRFVKVLWFPPHGMASKPGSRSLSRYLSLSLCHLAHDA
uniref:Putative secreted peptide n=1 Tax=Anopheles braziliensis TaxID=58242 RepID=A0A2M3ZVR5_9DIPT